MITPAAARHAELMAQAQEIKGRSLWVDARRRLSRNKAAMASIAILSVITLMAIFAPLLSPYSFDAVDYNVVSCAPDWWPDTTVMCNAGGAHWFGTDSIGRDLFVRVLYGARVSLAVGFVATLVSYLGPAVAGILTGSLVVEQIFGIPGIGRYFVQGALNRDYTLVLGVVIAYAALVIVMNLIADILYAVLDPRVRFD